MAGANFLGSIIPGGAGGGGFMNMLVWMTLGTIVLGGCGLSLWFMFKKKKSYNIKVEFRLPRNIQERTDETGKTKIYGNIRKEWGKGFYNPKEGVVYVKRPRKKPVVMKPFNIKEFLSDNNILTVIQVGIEDYRPVLEDSYLNLEDYDTQKEGALIKAKIDTSESKSWRNSYERERLSTYSIGRWLAEHGTAVEIAMIFIGMCVGFAIIYSKVA